MLGISDKTLRQPINPNTHFHGYNLKSITSSPSKYLTVFIALKYSVLKQTQTFCRQVSNSAIPVF